jgi:hypothetical protein
MKKIDWLLLFLSATFYAIPFLLPSFFWWLIFIFPVPLLYLTKHYDLSFVHGYVWGLAVFALHLSGGITILMEMAGSYWIIGFLMGMMMVLYQALVPALLLWCATNSVRFFAIHSCIIRLWIWTAALIIFVIYTDQYCLWIFGACEGYPLMHPLLPLMHYPALVALLPIIGKISLTLLFFLIPLSIVMLLWHKNTKSILFFCCATAPWIFSVLLAPREHANIWYDRVQSLPFTAHCSSDDPTVIMKIVAKECAQIIKEFPETELVIMPESAFNVTNFEKIPEMLQLWDHHHIGKRVHIIFGACRVRDGVYYNCAHWVCDGVLQECYDKKHAMLMTERLTWWMDTNYMRNIYCKDEIATKPSSNERIRIKISDTVCFVPYICSELFFYETADDEYYTTPIIALVNDALFLNSYINDLLLLLAQLRALSWQRDIIYVAYGRSVIIDRSGKLLNQ